MSETPKAAMIGRSRRGVAVLTFAAFLLSAASINAAVDMFLKIEGIDGESDDFRHPGASEVLSWSWGMSNPVSIGAGGATAVGQVVIESLAITKRLDKATPKLLESCANGSHFPRAVLTVRKADAGAVEFYRFVCEDVLVSSVTSQSVAGEDRPNETISLSFTRVGVEYISITPNGSPGEKVRFAWDAENNREGGVTFPGATAVDSDNDGVPDEWEIQFGLDPETDDANQDLDGDGATNYEEFIAGTNPTSKDSVFKAQFGATEGGATGMLSWSSAPGIQYRVLVSDRLDSPFQIFGTFPSDGEGGTSISVPVEVAMRFFRIEAVPAQ